jgi:hypothetical protein
MKDALRITVAWALDLCLWLLLIGIVVVLATGGGQVRLAGVLVRARSLGNPLLAVGALLALRWWFLAAVPLLGMRGRTLWSLADACRTGLARMRLSLETLSASQAVRVLALTIVAATIIRIANAVVHFGFITGDDVEIHEMSLGRAIGAGWPVWDLRNAFYPMAFIYPVQRLLVVLGLTDVFTLVLAGRLVVTAIAALNIVIVYRVGVRLFDRRGPALVAALLFAANHLHMAYGSAELPRVVATAFIVGAFGMALRSSLAAAAGAGALLGIGAALRFGEIVFLAPALLTIVAWGPMTAKARPDWTRRALAALALATVCLGTALAVLTVADRLYWGEALHSLRAIVDYTIVRGQSSRGFEPLWHYALEVASWSNVVLAGLGLASVRRGDARPLAWALVPIGLLSLLPHKEARYVIATIPFWSLAAASTVWWCADRIPSWPDGRRARGAALALVTLVIGGLLFDASRYRFRRSEDAVRLAWTLDAAGARGLAADQLWRLGGRLYLRRVEPLVDLDPGLADDGALARTVFCRPDVGWVALRGDRVTAARMEALVACGLSAVPSDPAAGYAVFRKARP